MSSPGGRTVKIALVQMRCTGDVGDNLARAAAKGREVEALCGESVLNDFEVCRTLWAFRVIGLVKRLEEARPFDDDGLEYVLPAEGHS